MIDKKTMVRLGAVVLAAILTTLAVATVIRSATAQWINWDEWRTSWPWLIGIGVGAGFAVPKFASWYDQLFRKDDGNSDD